MPCSESPKPGVVHGALVKNHERASGQLQGSGDAAFVEPCVGNGRNGPDMTVVVPQHMHFNSAPGLAKEGPGKECQAAPDGGLVQAEQPRREAELVFWALEADKAYTLRFSPFSGFSENFSLKFGQLSGDSHFKCESLDSFGDLIKLY